jgi:hypothetical protein
MKRQYDIHPSGIFVLLLITLHLLAMMSVALTDMPVWARAGIVLLVVASLLHHLHRHLRGKHAWRSVTLDQRELQVTSSDGAQRCGEVVQPTVVMPFCVVLCARLDGRPVCQPIFRDAMQAGAFRDLRVHLRFA